VEKPGRPRRFHAGVDTAAGLGFDVVSIRARPAIRRYGPALPARRAQSHDYVVLTLPISQRNTLERVFVYLRITREEGNPPS
jgi:hypothetical protein